MAKGFVGLDAFQKHCGSLQKQLTGPQLQAAIKRQTVMVQGEAKRGCPVNDGELRQSIMIRVSSEAGRVTGTVYTNKEHATYVEFGAGPKGEADHAGVSPEIALSYSQSPWWIHESQLDRSTAERYRWFYIDTPQGRFYHSSGQAANPFLYPALKNNEKRVMEGLKTDLKKEVRKGKKK